MIRNDPRSKFSLGPPQPRNGPAYTHPFLAPSLTYRFLQVRAGAFATNREARGRWTRSHETIREQLRLCVWEGEGGALAAEHHAPSGFDGEALAALLRRRGPGARSP